MNVKKRFILVVVGRPSQGGWATERRSDDIRTLWEFAKGPLSNGDCTCAQFYDRGRPIGQWKPERFDPSEPMPPDFIRMQQ